MENEQIPIQFSLDALASDTEEFINRANKKLNKRSRTLQQIDFLKVRKIWSNNRKVEHIYESLWPKLLKADEDAKQIQLAFEAKRESAISMGNNVSNIVEDHITGSESRINELDDLSNDCRQIIYDARKEISKILTMMQFNCELVVQRMMERHSRNDNQSPHVTSSTISIPSSIPNSDVVVHVASATASFAPTVVDSKPIKSCLPELNVAADSYLGCPNSDQPASDGTAVGGEVSPNAACNSVTFSDFDDPAVWQGRPRSPLMSPVLGKKERSWSFGESGLATVLTGAMSPPQGSPTQARKTIGGISSPHDQALSPFSVSSSSNSSSSMSSPDMMLLSFPMPAADDDSPCSTLSPVVLSPVPFSLTAAIEAENGSTTFSSVAVVDAVPASAGDEGDDPELTTTMATLSMPSVEPAVKSSGADPVNTISSSTIDKTTTIEAIDLRLHMDNEKGNSIGNEQPVTQSATTASVPLPNIAESKGISAPESKNSNLTSISDKNNFDHAVVEDVSTAEAEQWVDASSRRKMLTSKSVDLRSISFSFTESTNANNSPRNSNFVSTKSSHNKTGGGVASSAPLSPELLASSDDNQNISLLGAAACTTTSVQSAESGQKRVSSNGNNSSNSSTSNNSNSASNRSQTNSDGNTNKGFGGPLHSSSLSSSSDELHSHSSRRTPSSLSSSKRRSGRVTSMSKRDWHNDSNRFFNVDIAIESVLSDYTPAVVKQILQDKEHQILCQHLADVANVKVRLIPMQQNLLRKTEAESERLKRFKRHRSELASVFQIIKDEDMVAPPSPSSQRLLQQLQQQQQQQQQQPVLLSPSDIVRSRALSTSSSSSRLSNMSGNTNGNSNINSNGISSGKYTGNSIGSSSSDQLSQENLSRRKSGIASKLSKKLLSVFVPKSNRISSGSSFRGNNNSTSIGNDGLHKSASSDLSHFEDYGNDHGSLTKSGSHGSLAKSDSFESQLNEHGAPGMGDSGHSLGMLRTLSGSQVITRAMSYSTDGGGLGGGSGGSDYFVSTPREESESCDSLDDPDHTAICQTRAFIDELKVLIQQQQQIRDYTSIINNLVNSVSKAQQQLTLAKELQIPK